MAQTFTLDDFLEYKAILINGSEEEQRDIINRIRRTSSIEQSPPLDLIVKADLVPLLLKYHENHDISEASLQDILWTLANLGSGSGSETLYMVDNGGIEYFITFMHHASEKVYAQALWGLANVAGESAKFRDLLLGKGLLTQVIELYYQKKTVMKPDTRRTIAWLINNLCRNKPAVQFQKIEECLPYLSTSLKDSDSDVVVENLWSCCYITEISEQAVKAVTNWPIIERVVAKLIENITNLTIVAPALKTCSNVVSGNDEVTEKVLSLDILPTINELLYNSKSIIRREACYFLSNVAAGLPHQIDAIFDLQGIMDRLIVILKDDDIGVVNEAVWLVSNSVMGNNFDHARKIVNKNIYMPIFKRIGELGKRAQLMAMEGFRELLNHVMSMPDTPADILAQIKYYKENVEVIFQKQIDPMFTRTLSDIDNLISDVAENAKNVEVAFATFRAARTFICLIYYLHKQA